MMNGSKNRQKADMHSPNTIWVLDTKEERVFLSYRQVGLTLLSI